MTIKMLKHLTRSNKTVTPMKRSILKLVVLIMVCAGTVQAQQIPMFNSYTLNQFLINPSFAGLNGKTNIYGINRVQYAGFDGAPITYMLTADAGFKDKKFGVGGALFSDRNNLIAQNGFQLTYAYTLKLNDRWNVGLGLNAGMVQWTMNFDQLRVDDQSEDVISNVRSGATTFRSDFGFRVSSDKFDFGLALPQLVSSKVKYSNYLTNSNGQFTSIPHYIVNLSYLLALSESIKLKPIVVVRGAQDISPQIDIVGMLDWKNKAYATVGYRTNYAFSVGGGLRLSKGISVGYSFDRPVNDISKFAVGSHEVIIGVTIGGKSGEKPEPAGAITKELETKLKTDIEKQLRNKLSSEFENKLNQELNEKVIKAVEVQLTKALADRPASTTPADGKTVPSTGVALSAEDMDKMKKEIEEKIRKQMAEDFNKLIDEKIKKSIDSKPATTAQPNKEETERSRKESEEKIRKEVEEKLRKELTDKINKAVDEKIEKEVQKTKDEALKTPKNYEMTLKDKMMLDSLKMKNLENEKRIADLEIQLKNFPESDRVENEELRNINRIAHQNDIELKKFKNTNQDILDAAADAKPKKTGKTEKTEESDEPSKFVIVLAGFKTLKEAQKYQKLASQTFEFPNCKILKPEQLEGWYFVYQKSFEKKKMAFDAHTKLTESKFNTPNFPWIYVLE